MTREEGALLGELKRRLHDLLAPHLPG